MSESPGSVPSPADFLAEVEQLLTPGYAECFTDETRKVRNLLLVTSFVLILFVLGVVTVGDNVKLPLLGLTITVKAGMRYVLMALCSYFLLLLAARSYTEWRLWRLRHQAPMIQLLDLAEKIKSSWQARTNEANTTMNSMIDALKRLTESNLELMHSDQELLQLDDQGRNERAARNREINAEKEELLRQLAELENVHRSQTAAPELKVLEAQLGYLHDAVRPVSKTLTIRFWFEMLFPIFFGALAIVLGFFVHEIG